MCRNLKNWTREHVVYVAKTEFNLNLSLRHSTAIYMLVLNDAKKTKHITWEIVANHIKLYCGENYSKQEEQSV